MLGAHLRAFFFQPAADLHHATGAIHRHAGSTACCNIVQLVLEDILRDIRMTGQRVRPTEPTAAIGVGHLDQIVTGGFDQLARLFPDLGAPLNVTGIVVGHFFAARQFSKNLGTVELVDDESGGINGNFSKLFRLGSPGRIILEMFDEIAANYAPVIPAR